MYNTGMHSGYGGGFHPFPTRGIGGGDTGISSANNSLASMFGSLLGNQSQNRATDAGLMGGAYNTQAGLLGSIFGNQTNQATSQFGSLADLLSNMYSSKAGATASLGNAAAGRDASFQNAQAGLLGQGLQSQADVIGSLSGVQSGLNSGYANLDSQAMNNQFEMQKLGALAPLLGGLFGRSSGGGGSLPSFSSNFGQAARWS
jgi:hypothetical protein